MIINITIGNNLLFSKKIYKEKKDIFIKGHLKKKNQPEIKGVQNMYCTYKKG